MGIDWMSLEALSQAIPPAFGEYIGATLIRPGAAGRLADALKAHRHIRGERVLYSERSHESYARAFELPQAVDAQAAEAKFENGVLMLTLPKRTPVSQKRLAIH